MTVLLHEECLTSELLAEQNTVCSHFLYIELYQAAASPDWKTGKEGHNELAVCVCLYVCVRVCVCVCPK